MGDWTNWWRVIFPVEAGIHGCWASYPPDYQTFMTGLKFIICKRDCPLLCWLPGGYRPENGHEIQWFECGSNQIGTFVLPKSLFQTWNKSFPIPATSTPVSRIYSTQVPKDFHDLALNLALSKKIRHPIFQFQWIISFPLKVAICGYSPIFRQTHFNPRNSS